MNGGIPFSLVFSLLSADYFASVIVTLFRGGEMSASEQATPAPRQVVGGRFLPQTCTTFSLGLIKYGLFETVMKDFTLHRWGCIPKGYDISNPTQGRRPQYGAVMHP